MRFRYSRMLEVYKFENLQFCIFIYCRLCNSTELPNGQAISTFLEESETEQNHDSSLRNNTHCLDFPD